MHVPVILIIPVHVSLFESSSYLAYLLCVYIYIYILYIYLFVLEVRQHLFLAVVVYRYRYYDCRSLHVDLVARTLSSAWRVMRRRDETSTWTDADSLFALSAFYSATMRSMLRRLVDGAVTALWPFPVLFGFRQIERQQAAHVCGSSSQLGFGAC